MYIYIYIYIHIYTIDRELILGNRRGIYNREREGLYRNLYTKKERLPFTHGERGYIYCCTTAEREQSLSLYFITNEKRSQPLLFPPLQIP
jgi:hypothetical protein